MILALFPVFWHFLFSLCSLIFIQFFFFLFLMLNIHSSTCYEDLSFPWTHLSDLLSAGQVKLNI
ncbi:hypothetical protein BJY00DRAFT_297194 [Aspergillus carlsbadensis]|nr:hypothetical protein BJY00DRAFT_297194 [Aspergillus carlsbadensis]